MSRIIIAFFTLVLFSQCGGESSESDGEAPQSLVSEQPANTQKVQDDADWKSNKGFGPIKNVSLGDLDEEMAAKGKDLYNIYCLACHKVDEDYIGPTPKGILDRRSPEWVMNMIINPTEMLAKDPIAKALLVEYNNVPMASMGLDETQTRQILEYFRTLE